MTNLTKQLLKSIENDFAEVIEKGAISDVSGYIDTGAYALNALLSGSIYGGYPNNLVTALAGEEGSGKTFAALSAAKSFLDKHEDGTVFYFESEGAVNKNTVESRGIDSSRFVLCPVAVVEQFKVQMNKLLDSYAKSEERTPILVILDSLGMLSTNKEAADSLSGSDKKDMTRPSAIRALFRTITLKATAYKVPIILTNHTYQSIGSFIPMKEMAGGGGVKYAASNILFLSKSKERDSQKELVGNKVLFNLTKGRLTKEGQKVRCLISFEHGLDKYEGLVEIGEKLGLIKKSGKGLYKFPNDVEVKAKALKNKPEEYFTPSVLDMIDAECGKLFLYGSDQAVIAEE